VAAGAGVIHYWWLVKKGVMSPGPFTLVLTGLLLARVVWSVRSKRRKAAAIRPAVTPVVAP
jgi:sulfoxide reductase heme-binding subunit YedZ